MKIIGTKVYECEQYDEAKAALSFLESKGYFGYVVCNDNHLFGLDPRTLKNTVPMIPAYSVFIFELAEEVKLQ